VNTIQSRASAAANSRWNQRRRLRGRIIVACAVGPIVAALAPWSWAGVQLSNVAAGSASISQQGSITTIRTGTNNTILYFSKFDIAGGSTVNFLQPSAAGRVLDHVTSATPSLINGTLESNGTVYLINPAGVIFGAGAVVDVNRFYAAAANFSNQDFLSGIDHFTGVSGMVSNSGQIRANQVSLIGSQVMNQGNIVAPNGYVAMLAGSDVLVSEEGSHITARVAAPVAGAGATASGSSSAAAAARDLRNSAMAAGDVYSLAIRHTGRIEASNVLINGGGGQVQVSGSIDASTHSAGAVGGNVAITGGEVDLVSAEINASGPGGGGSVEIGGGEHGGGDLPHAQIVSVDSNSTIDADAMSNGPGGTIALWSDGTTSDSGALSARGGALGGNGGYIETSGAVLQVISAPNASAPHGTGGVWYLDPATDVDIVNAANDATQLTATNPASNTGSTVNNGSIDTALGAGTNVIISTDQTGLLGNIVQSSNAPIAVTLANAGAVTLTLQANLGLTLPGGISTGSGSTVLNVELDQVNGTLSAVNISAPININGTLKIVGGNVTVASGGNLTASSVTLTSGPVTGLSTTSYPSALGAVIIDAPIVTNGGTASITTATSVTSNAGGTINTTGATNGEVDISSSGAISIGDRITTGTTSGGGGVYIDFGNSGSPAPTAGGPITIGAAIGTGGGVFSAGGTAFSSTGGITTAGGNVTLRATGADSIGAAVSTGAGAFSATGATTFTTTSSGSIATTGSNVTISTTGAVLIGAAVSTGGGGFAATGTSFENDAAISGGTGSAAMTVNTSSGIGTIDINGAITWAGTGGVDIEGGGGVGSTAAGTITYAGSSGTTVSLFTTGAGAALTVGGNVNTSGVFTASGGNFTLGAANSLRASSASINVAATTTIDAKAVTPSTVSIDGSIDATVSGGQVLVGGLSLVSAASTGTITTTDGNVLITVSTGTTLDALVATSGGKFSATGGSSFTTNTGGTINTTGATNGEVDISSSGAIIIGDTITTGSTSGGGGIYIDFGNSGSPVATHGGPISIGAALATGGGVFSAGGTTFTSSAAPTGTTTPAGTLTTSGGSLTLSPTGAVLIGALVNTGGGGFAVTAGGNFENDVAITDGGSNPSNHPFAVNTSSGTGTININGAITWAGTGGVDIEGATTVTTSANGTIASEGSAAVPVSLYTTGVGSGNGITVGAAVNTNGAFTASGANFTLGAALTANSASINVATISALDSKTVTPSTVAINEPVVTAASGNFQGGGTTFTSNATGTITSGGGSVSITTSLTTTLGAEVNTGGGAFSATAPEGFTNNAAITVGTGTTSTNAFSVTTAGSGSISINGPVTWAGHGGVTITGDGQVSTTSLGTITSASTGAAATPVSLFTTVAAQGSSGQTGVTVGAAVNTNGAFVASGGNFILSSGIALTAASVSLNVATTSPGGATNPGTVTIGGPIVVTGVAANGAIDIGGTILLTDNGTGTLTTNGGPVAITNTGLIGLGNAVVTAGGAFSVTGSSNFTASSAPITTSGGSVTITTTTTDGAVISSGSPVNTGGGSFTVSAQTFENDSTISDGGVATANGTLNIDTTSGTGVITINGAITWIGGTGRSVVIQGGGDVNVGSIASSGAAALPVSFFTTGAGNSVTINGTVNTTGAFVSSGGAFNVASGGTLTAQNVTLNIATAAADSKPVTPGAVNIAGGVTTNAGIFTAGGTSFTSSGGGSVTTNGGNVDLLTSGTVNLGAAVNTGGGTFNATLDNDFTSTSGGTITTVGGAVTITSTGAVSSGTGEISIGDEINTGGGSFSASGTTFTSSGEITDGGINDAQGLSITTTGGDITLNTGGDINWSASLAPVAFVMPSGSSLNLGAAITVNPSEPLNFTGFTVSLVGTAATVSGGNITFGTIVNPDNTTSPALTVQSAGAVSFATVGTSASPIGSLTVTTNGSSAEPVTTLNGNIFTVGDVVFGGSVVLAANVAITASDISASSTANHDLEFDGTIEGPQGLTLAMPLGNGNLEQIRFNSNIGDQTPLAYLAANSGAEGFIFFRGGLPGSSLIDLPGIADPQPATVVDIASGGSFTVNNIVPSPKRESTIIASIGSYGPLTINIGSASSPNAANLFAMGQYEKLTTYGDLTINTNGGTAQAGDLSAFGNLTINAANIEFLLRTPTLEGQTALDEGVDLIANGEISLPANATYSAVSPSGPGAFGVPGFIARSFNPSSNIAATASSLKTVISIVPSISATALFYSSPNLLLDLTPATLGARLPAFIPPIPFVFDLPIAGAVPRQQLVAGTVTADFKNAFMASYPGPIVEQDLRDDGVFTREPSVEEILAATDSIVEYNDTPRKRRPSAEDFAAVVSRMNSSRVQKFLDQYQEMFSNGPGNSPNMPSRRAQIAGDLQEAWDAYVSQNGYKQATGAGFQQYVAATPSAAKASNELVQLNSLLQQLGTLGLSDKEAHMAFQHNILAGLPANGMQDNDLIAAVESAGNGK